ncbi:MAG: dockerin type I repeat-containing protein, partial [Clostridia bacterium]|nr:dockerin type I repeat-containing protein [Clostridia bacterium]
TALSGFSSVVIFDEIVDVTLCGLHGISMGSDHDDDPEVMVQGDAFVYCRSYKTGVTSANPVSQCYAAFDCDYLSVYGCGKIVCEAEGQTAAMKTAGSWFLDDVFDIEIIKIGEYCEPYGVAGLNYPGEVDESECRYVSIWRGHGEISHLAVTMPVPRAGERIGYDGFRALGRGYGIEDFTDGRRWLNGVKWFVGTGMIDLKIYDENYFEAGETYTVYISLVINDGRYSFVDPDYATAEVNGERADITVYSNENFGVYFSFTVPEEPVIPAGRLGDVNDDGDIGAVDYLMVKRNVLGTFDLDDGQTYRADVNRSGDITAVDYLMIKRHVLGSYTIG